MRTSCENCHAQGYSEMLDQWQKEVTAQVASIKGKIESFKQTLQDLKRVEGRGENEELIKSALNFSEIRLNLVEKDGSQGGHNYTLISKMLEEANLKLDQTRQMIQ